MMMNKLNPREQEIQKLIEKVLENGVDRVDDDRYGEHSECPYCFNRGELYDKMEDIKTRSRLYVANS